MSHFVIKCRSVLTCLSCVVVVITLSSSVLFAQPKYRTFQQQDLGEKKNSKAGKVVAAKAWFKFTNSTGVSMPSLHVKFNAPVVTLEDSGGLLVSLNGNRKLLDAFGTILPGDVIAFTGLFAKANSNIRAEWYWGDGSVTQAQATQATAAMPVVQQPNGGNVLVFLHKNIIRKPDGVVVGVPNATNDGWIRYKTADRKVFPHTADARCFDRITNGNGTTKDFAKELKNPQVKKHDNHLLGEVYALRLAIIANDRGVTLPDTPSTRLGDIVYYDSSNLGDLCNGKTLRQISWLADTALTYCALYDSTADFYEHLDSCVSRINNAFVGPYKAISFDPFILDGTHSIDESPFLHDNPSATPIVFIPYQRASIIDDVPEQFILQQNYPNPFNPTTNIDFTLSFQSIVTLKVYNLLGQEVATLLDNELLDDGDQSVDFIADGLTSGVYFYRISAQSVEDETQHFASIKRMLLLK